MTKLRTMYILANYIKKVGKTTAVLSFLSATVLFLSLPSYTNEFSVRVSFYMVIAVVLINLLVGMMVIICCFFYPFIRKQLIKVIGLMLINIPITVFYLKLLPYTMS
ncbi:hypothetical protein GTQ40_15790 [Flavobacteriaceae bacterium R38]|nr:hypothetical protein [Flavobacteriaceae bacterium R38]